MMWYRAENRAPGTGGRTSTETSTRVEMGTRTGAGTGEKTGTIIEIKVAGRESLGIDEVVIEMGRKTRKGGRR